ncbi:MAG: TetR family transcriptional regulator [Candidatus Lokiarchaeota archaeon]|nr:TetR family transcriptional regulator [Candidatus Lokiarchaeota archaeon]MBD3198483.1 TetR family transcriptional regulator [Candidatus Lokiarchaeota archaeon]
MRWLCIPNESSAKRRIIETAIDLISKKGYHNVSTREIARKADVSDGTLYYHFPKGKISVLISLWDELSKDLDYYEIIEDGIITEDEIHQFFIKDLDLARKMREFIIAMEIELLEKPDFYINYSQKFTTIDKLEPFKKIVEAIVEKEISNHTLFRIISIWKALIRRHVIFRNLYGSDEEFIKMMKNIFRALAKEED